MLRYQRIFVESHQATSYIKDYGCHAKCTFGMATIQHKGTIAVSVPQLVFLKKPNVTTLLVFQNHVIFI